MKNTLLMLACSMVMTAWAQTPRLQHSKQQHKKQTIFLPQTEIEQYWNGSNNRWDTAVVYKITYQNGLKMVDSFYNYPQNPLIASNMTLYSYDNARRLLQEIRLNIRSTGQIDTSTKTVYTYNTQGNLVSEVFLLSNPNPNNNTLDTSYATITNFLYDAQNRITQFEDSDWDRDSGGFILSNRTKFFYTGNQQAPDSIVLYIATEGELELEFVAKVEFIEWNRFDPLDGSKFANYTIYQFNGVDFDVDQIATFEYNQQGDLTKELTLSADGDTTNFSIIEYTYNPDGAMTSAVFKNWDEGIIRNSTRYLYSNFVAFTGLKKQLTANFVIYPNPANDQLHINGIAGEAQCSIFSINGQQMLSQTLSNAKQSIDISLLPAGVYFVTIKQNDLVERKKFVISK